MGSPEPRATLTAGMESAELVFESQISAGRQRVATEHFDIVVADVSMPGMSGDELLEFWKACPPSTHVVLSGSAGHSQGPLVPSVLVSLQWKIGQVLQPIGTANAKTSASEEGDADADSRSAVRRRVLEASFRERERLLHDALGTADVAALLGVSRQTPHDRAKARTLLAIEDKNSLRFPPWQFDANGPNGIVSGLPDVLSALAVGPLAQARWLTRSNAVLEGRTPLQALRDGEIERVVSEALGVGAAAAS